MKLVQAIPAREAGVKLKSALDAKERELRGTNTTFYRGSRNKWKHTRYNGWINIEGAVGGILLAEVRSKAENTEWQLLQAFIGYLQRHFADSIDSITITFR